MKQRLCILLCLILFCMPLTGCLKYLFEGESAPLSKKIISVTMPSEKVPPTVKPLPEPASAKDKTPAGSETHPVQVDKRLLPQDVPEKSKIEIPLQPALPAGSNGFAPGIGMLSPVLAADQAHPRPVTVINEDVTWRGTIDLPGAVVVAAHATLRIEAGAVIRFAAVPRDVAPPVLLVQGRIHCSGGSERPVLFTTQSADKRQGRWGGIVFMASDKRNLLEYCRIEDADTAVSARFSTVTLKGVTVVRARIGLAVNDALVQLGQSSLTECELAVDSRDSELDIRETTIYGNRRGVVARASSLSMSASKISRNEQIGLQLEDVRMKLVAGELSENGSGASIKGGEGQIVSTRFVRNRDSALQLAAARIKVTRCTFSENLRDAVRLQDGKALLWGCSFSENGGFNLYNGGRDDVTALQNWWGSSDESAVLQKIYDASRDQNSGAVTVFPWLLEKPQLSP